MKADCKINMKELVNVVDGMLAEKNEVGRQAFQAMTEDHLDNPGGQNMIEGYADHIFEIVGRNGLGEDAKGQVMEFIDSILDEEKANAQGGLKEWSNPNFDGEGAFEELYDELQELMGMYANIVKDGPESQHQDPRDVAHREVYKEVAKDLKKLLLKIEKEYGV